MNEQKFEIKTNIFNGPLDLLLNLIEKRKLFINDFSLAEVTEDYLDYIKQQENFPIKDSAEFILIASTLLLIKSRSLLPELPLTQEEEEDIADLENRLVLYNLIKKASIKLSKQYGHNPMYLPKNQQSIVLFTPSKSVNQNSITEAIKRVLFNLPKPLFIPQAIVKKIISLEEIMSSLIKRIKQGLSISFKSMADQQKAKETIVMNFLAVLELVKKGIIVAEQNNNFDDIILESPEPMTPAINL